MTNSAWRILDTDHISLHQRNHPAVTARLQAYPPTDLFVTIISFEEQIRGRLSFIRQARDAAAQVLGYFYLQETLRYYSVRQVLPYDDAAAAQFTALRPTLRSIGTQDLKIAAIALSTGATLVTRNTSDFGQVPGLTIEDWSISKSP